MERALKEINPETVARARESVRRLIEGGRIALKPSKDGSSVEGDVALIGLGEHALSAGGGPALLGWR